jgi:GT2 family glycosyltransferase
MKSIAVVLVDWNGVEITKECLASLKKVETSFLDMFQIIVVDNGSDLPDKDVLENEFNDFIFLRSETNRGFAGGNNLGIKYAIENNFTYTLLLNNDTTVDPDFLKPLFETMESNKNIAAAQPKIYFAHNRSLLWNAGTKFNHIFGTASTRGYNEIDIGQYDDVKTMPWLTGCCMLINNEVLMQHIPSLLNEQFKTYFEDVKLSFDLRKAGYELMYVPSSKIWHIAGYSAEQNKDKEGKMFPEIVYLHTRNKIWIARAYSLSLTQPLAMFWQYGYCLLLLTYYAIKGRWKKCNKVIQAMQDGWRSQPC